MARHGRQRLIPGRRIPPVTNTVLCHTSMAGSDVGWCSTGWRCHVRTHLAVVVLLFAPTCESLAADRPPNVPLVAGLVIVSVTRSPDGDRENAVTVQQVSRHGVRYAWQSYEPAPGGGRQRLDFAREVRAADLAAGGGLHTIFSTADSGPQPGTTSLLLSRAVYARLVKDETVSLPITMLAPGTSDLVTLQGNANVVGPRPISFPVLLNGERVSLPALQVQVVLQGEGRQFRSDFLILADATHPLILRNDRAGPIRTQVVRIDHPSGTSILPARVGAALDARCRAELPGVYFDVGSAELDDRSSPVLQELAALLVRHPEWVVQIEGHTDNIGSAAANLALSIARAAAVHDFLIQRPGISARNVRSNGLGAIRPRETNDTLEGRARNRRVEITRECAGASN